MCPIFAESLEMHRRWQGKLEVTSKVPLCNAHELALDYTPGVAEPCCAIHQNTDEVVRPRLLTLFVLFKKKWHKQQILTIYGARAPRRLVALTPILTFARSATPPQAEPL